MNLHRVIELCDAHVLYDLVHCPLLHNCKLAAKVVLHYRPQDVLLSFPNLLPYCYSKRLLSCLCRLLVCLLNFYVFIWSYKAACPVIDIIFNVFAVCI